MKNTKGIILAGGSGTRLRPITSGVCKPLLPIYNKPTIFYPLSILIESGIKDILIISDKSNVKSFENLFGNGSELGLNICYKVQEKPNGLAEAFIIGEDFIGNDDVCLILGDNIIHGPKIDLSLNKGCKVFGYRVSDPRAYGCIEFNNSKIISIEEKPENPKSNTALIGLYCFDSGCVQKAKSLKPSKRNELEIVDLIKLYSYDDIEFTLLSGYAWFDSGTPDSLLQVSNYVQAIEQRQGINIGHLEILCFSKGLISLDNLVEFAHTKYRNSEYGKSILKFVEEI